MNLSPLPTAVIPSRSGSLTLKVGGQHWHSAYDPQREARQWVDRLSVDRPCVLLLGDGLGYAAEALRERFPRLVLLERPYPLGGEAEVEPKEFYQAHTTGLSWSRYQVLIWPAAQRIHPEWVRHHLSAWTEVVLEKQADLATHEGLGRRWLLNVLRRAWRQPRIYRLEPLDQPVLVIASGPSAENWLSRAPRRAGEVRIALASATWALEARGLEWDLYGVTDGGYWAARLEPPRPLPRLASFNSVLEPTPRPWVAFAQGYHYERFLLGEGLVPQVSPRGTVTFSVLTFLAQHCRGPIGVVGLDLGESRGRGHVLPHPIEEWELPHRLCPLETSELRRRDQRAAREQGQGFVVSAAAQLYARGLAEIAYPHLYRVDPSPVELANMKALSAEAWVRMTSGTVSQIPRLREVGLSSPLPARLLQWKEAVERELELNADSSLLREVQLHLCPRLLHAFDQARLEGSEAGEERSLLLQETRRHWFGLWKKGQGSVSLRS